MIPLMCVLFPACQSVPQDTSNGALEPATTTVCAIAKAPRKFNHAVVLVRAHVESDGFEHTDLVDQTCETLGISLDYSLHFKGHDDLVNAIHSPSPGTVDKEISGIFIGRIEWHSKTDFYMQLTGMRNLRVVKTVSNGR
jgi:hypothetical protein